MEYGGPDIRSVQSRVQNRKWLEEFGGLLGNRIEDMIGVEGLTRKELTLISILQMRILIELELQDYFWLIFFLG